MALYNSHDRTEYMDTVRDFLQRTVDENETLEVEEA